MAQFKIVLFKICLLLLQQTNKQTKMSEHRIIVAGTRMFSNYALLSTSIYNFVAENQLAFRNVEIVSGGAKGADSLGEYFAIQHSLALKRFPANWELYKRRAGFLRNYEMAEYANFCIVFWDGESKGTKHMIDIATIKMLPTKIINYTPS